MFSCSACCVPQSSFTFPVFIVVISTLSSLTSRVEKLLRRESSNYNGSNLSRFAITPANASVAASRYFLCSRRCRRLRCKCDWSSKSRCRRLAARESSEVVHKRIVASVVILSSTIFILNIPDATPSLPRWLHLLCRLPASGLFHRFRPGSCLLRRGFLPPVAASYQWLDAGRFRA